MCFSAEASFGASAVLGTIGVIALRKTTHPNQNLFAAIPIFFALQQLSEGFVWLSFMIPKWEPYRLLFASVFLVFALLVWPVWVPLSVWLLEQKNRFRKLLLALVLFGFSFALLVGFFLFSHSVFPEILNHHIHYQLGFKNELAKGASLFYFIPTILPPLFSPKKPVKLVGIFLLVSYLFSQFYFPQAVVSVWCFLAAFVSLLVLRAVLKMQEDPGSESANGAGKLLFLRKKR